MSMEPADEQLPPRGHVRVVYLGPVAPHWRVDSDFGDRSVIEEFRQRALARLLRSVRPLRVDGLDDERLDLGHVEERRRLVLQHRRPLVQAFAKYLLLHQRLSESHVHAALDLPFDEQPAYMLLWEKLDGVVEHISGKVMVCGHTRQKDGVPLDLGATVCIDTGIYDEQGWLTCLHVETGRYWQANQRGQTRTGHLERDGG